MQKAANTATAALNKGSPEFAAKVAEIRIKQSEQQLRQLSSHIQTLKEEERARLSREIHDDLGGTLTPYDQISGTLLEFSYDAPVFGSSSVTFTYRLANKDFAPFNDLRFFLDLKTKGQASFQDTTAVVGFGAPTVPGAADHFQIFDFNAPGDKPLQQIASTSNLNDGTAAACSTGCFSDLALQWNRPELLVGDTWEIKATLVDDPSLVAGGRYLLASSLGADGTQIIFGSPTPVPLPPALLLLGSGLAWLFAFRRRQA